MVFSWYGTGSEEQDDAGVPPAWTPTEWALWKAVMAEPAVPAGAARPRPAADSPVTHALPTVDTVPRSVAALLGDVDRRSCRLAGPIPAGCLGHIVSGLLALIPPHCPLQPYLITLDVAGMPQGLWSCATSAAPGLVPVTVPAPLLLRVARRLSPAGTEPAGVAPALLVWQVFWPECVDPRRVGGLGETLRSVGALQLATRLLAEECGLRGELTRALPDPHDLRELGWPAERVGIVGGCALGRATEPAAIRRGDRT